MLWEWELFKTDLIPGEKYSFVLTPHDPAFREEINITNALHLDENRSFISNIFDEVQYQDDLWSEYIYSEEYVRVTFEENLTNGSIINLYVRDIEGSQTYIEIYEKDSEKILAMTPIINESVYNLKLIN